MTHSSSLLRVISHLGLRASRNILAVSNSIAAVSTPNPNWCQKEYSRLILLARPEAFCFSMGQAASSSSPITGDSANANGLEPSSEASVVAVSPEQALTSQLDTKLETMLVSEGREGSNSESRGATIPEGKEGCNPEGEGATIPEGKEGSNLEGKGATTPEGSNPEAKEDSNSEGKGATIPEGKEGVTSPEGKEEGKGGAAIPENVKKENEEEEAERALKKALEELGEPPERPLAGDCCGQGCDVCVWDTYNDELRDYLARRKALLKSPSNRKRK